MVLGLGPVREEQEPDDTAIIPLPVVLPTTREGDRGGVIVIPTAATILRRIRRRARRREDVLPREKIRVSVVLRRQQQNQPVAVIRLAENQVDRGVVRRRDMEEIAGYVRRGARFIREGTPVKTGRLRSTIRPSGVIRGRAGMRIRARTPYAGFVEFGTRFITPRRYMARGLTRMVREFSRRKYAVIRAGF